MHSDESEVKKISEQCSASSISIKQLLDIDVMNHVLDKSKVYAPI
jgi:hypothetical protein